LTQEINLCSSKLAKHVEVRRKRNDQRSKDACPVGEKGQDRVFPGSKKGKGGWRVPGENTQRELPQREGGNKEEEKTNGIFEKCFRAQSNSKVPVTSTCQTS